MNSLNRFLLSLLFATITITMTAEEEVEKEEDEIAPPQAVYKVDPSHPPELFEKGIAGHAIIVGTVDMFGSIINPHIESATHNEFGMAAILACSEWIFEPATKNGVPIEIGIRLPFNFEISFEHALNVELGREVFKKIEDPILPSADLDISPSPRFIPVFDDFYPEEFEGSGVAAALSIEFIIGPEGLVHNPKVISSSMDGFEEAALEAVSQIKYQPIAVNGKHAYISMKLPVHISE
ncbi:energy transducer TonB [Puniceicoccaceae bacterium K14]|nr:energy transducer TonB [Puniceicoccaceae bacterium K14]